jgi:hypothetical protein
MVDADSTVAFVMRNGLDPFEDISADYMCKRCCNPTGNSHGFLHPLSGSILREPVDRTGEWDSGFDRDTPKSVHAFRLFERIGVAQQKCNAQGISDFRYNEVG